MHSCRILPIYAKRNWDRSRWHVTLQKFGSYSDIKGQAEILCYRILKSSDGSLHLRSKILGTRRKYSYKIKKS